MIKKELPSSKIIGILDQATVTSEWLNLPPESVKKPSVAFVKTRLEDIINLNDFEEAAAAFLSKNSLHIRRFERQPDTRCQWILVPTDMVPTSSTTECGDAGLAKTAGPDGELALAAGASIWGLSNAYNAALYNCMRRTATKHDKQAGQDENSKV
ncbi:hypothetical protein DL98DRAFT_527154 [Cadophora sp. DSE1049]|nr:hypothetical protein DL98DRAFT_527154 [Cadophora sp. DSE1049]